MIILSPSQFDYQLFRTLLAQYARSFNITVVSVTIVIIIIIPIIIIVIVIIIIVIIIVIIRENVAVVNVFLDAPQTQILDVNEKTSIIDAVKYAYMGIRMIFLQNQIVRMILQVSSVGGLLGLFMGFTFVTVIT